MIECPTGCDSHRLRAMFGKLEVNREGKGFDQVREDELRITNAQRAKRCQQPTDDLDSCAGIAFFFYGFFVAVKGISGQAPHLAGLRYIYQLFCQIQQIFKSGVRLSLNYYHLYESSRLYSTGLR